MASNLIRDLTTSSNAVEIKPFDLLSARCDESAGPLARDRRREARSAHSRMRAANLVGRFVMALTGVPI